jgi:hypothetical protein
MNSDWFARRVSKAKKQVCCEEHLLSGLLEDLQQTRQKSG